MAAATIYGLMALAACAAASDAPPNILYLMSDDMRPQLGCYGQNASTPNLDALAAEGMVFERAFTQYAYCAPSRASFLTGRRPERTLVLNFDSTFRDHHGDAWVTMPQFFKNNGYFTTSAGKLYHGSADDAASWTEGLGNPYGSNQTKWIQCQCDQGDACDEYQNYCAITANSTTPETDEDLIIFEGLKRLRYAANLSQPWFVGVGTHRPHWRSRLPAGWTGPEVYPTGVLAPKFPKAPIGAPYMSGNWQEGDYLDPAHGCPNCSVPDERAIEYRRWYYAATSYADHELGMVLDELDVLGKKASTVTIFHADHGYQLGELNEWSKKTNTELAVRVPMIIRVPGKAPGRTRVAAELVDLYRTLVDLAGLDAAAIQDDVQGASLAAVFDDADALAGKVAYSQIGSCACHEYDCPVGGPALECGAGRCIHTNVSDFDFMGYSVRTDRWRCTAWVPMNPNTSRVDWSRRVYHELYDVAEDDGLLDFDREGYAVNVAKDHPKIVAELSGLLRVAVESWY